MFILTYSLVYSWLRLVYLPFIEIFIYHLLVMVCTVCILYSLIGMLIFRWLFCIGVFFNYKNLFKLLSLLILVFYLDIYLLVYLLICKLSCFNYYSCIFLHILFILSFVSCLSRRKKWGQYSLWLKLFNPIDTTPPNLSHN